MSRIVLLDETNRPKAPPIAGATAQHRQQGRRLAAIHALHLEQIGQVRALIDRIVAGETGAAELADALAAMDMMRNIRLFGAMCGRECDMLTFHHTSEDNEIFPLLRQRGGPGLQKVIDKLAAEHLVVHDLIEALQRLADAAIATPQAQQFEQLVVGFDRLEAVVRSHFGYEETELAEALGFYGTI